MGNHKDWASLRSHAIQTFGDTPHPQTEADIIQVYEQHPEALERAIDAIATDVQNGTIRSGWAVTRKRALNIQTPPSNPTAKTGIDREKAIARTEQWMRNAGAMFDRESEILDELFSDRGPLRPYAQTDLERRPDGSWHQTPIRGDTHLAEQMLNLWHQHRPAGEKVEADELERANTWKAQQVALRERLKAEKAALDEAQERGGVAAGASPSTRPAVSADATATPLEQTPVDPIPY